MGDILGPPLHPVPGQLFVWDVVGLRAPLQETGVAEVPRTGGVLPVGGVLQAVGPGETGVQEKEVGKGKRAKETEENKLFSNGCRRKLNFFISTIDIFVQFITNVISVISSISKSKFNLKQINANLSLGYFGN